MIEILPKGFLHHNNNSAILCEVISPFLDAYFTYLQNSCDNISLIMEIIQLGKLNTFFASFQFKITEDALAILNENLGAFKEHVDTCQKVGVIIYSTSTFQSTFAIISRVYVSIFK